MRSGDATEKRLHDEVGELTRELIRIDTSNPPGRESEAAGFLAGWLVEAGVESELAGPDPERLNLVARIPGAGEGPSLMLMAHTDVVPAPDADWTVPPFAGELRDGRVVGRTARRLDRTGRFEVRLTLRDLPGGDRVRGRAVGPRGTVCEAEGTLRG